MPHTGLATILAMDKALTADDILPLVATLTLEERARLLRMIAARHGADASVYRRLPATREEFGSDEEPLAWDADG